MEISPRQLSEMEQALARVQVMEGEAEGGMFLLAVENLSGESAMPKIFKKNGLFNFLRAVEIICVRPRK